MTIIMSFVWGLHVWWQELSGRQFPKMDTIEVTGATKNTDLMSRVDLLCLKMLIKKIKKK